MLEGQSRAEKEQHQEGAVGGLSGSGRRTAYGEGHTHDQWSECVARSLSGDIPARWPSRDSLNVRPRRAPTCPLLARTCLSNLRLTLRDERRNHAEVVQPKHPACRVGGGVVGHACGGVEFSGCQPTRGESSVRLDRRSGCRPSHRNRYLSSLPERPPPAVDDDWRARPRLVARRQAHRSHSP